MRQWSGELKQLTSETKILKIEKGRRVYRWDARGRRNEALDCCVYALAALRISQQRFGLDLDALALAKPVDAEVVPVPTGIEYPDYDGPITVIVPPPAEPDILETYMIANSVSLVVLPDRTPLDAAGLRVSRDIDSFSWALSASLFGRTSLNRVRPDADGPKEVELTINGHVWVFLIERYSGTGKLADERYTLTGVSRTQLLAEPYAPRRSQTNSAPVNASWAVGAELEHTGFDSEWSIGLPDWTLPATAMSYQDKTPMQVIAQLAETAGGVVRPALASDEITILPRYREPVWQWSSAIMDRIIPAQMVSEWGSEWQPQPEWNSCYVSGTNHGVAVNVRRAGTAGELAAPEVYDDWMTDTQPARSRGIAEISKGGNQEIVTLNLPLFAEQTAPGLIEPAMLCEVRDVDETWRGLCLSTEISAEGLLLLGFAIGWGWNGSRWDTRYTTLERDHATAMTNQLTAARERESALRNLIGMMSDETQAENERMAT